MEQYKQISETYTNYLQCTTENSGIQPIIMIRNQNRLSFSKKLSRFCCVYNAKLNRIA